MLKELFEKGYINYEKLIIDNAKALSLKTGEILVLFKIIEQALAKKTLNVTEIRESLVISKPKLDACLARLMERSFYEIYISYENGEGYEIKQDAENSHQALQDCIRFLQLFLCPFRQAQDEAVFLHSAARVHNARSP